MTYNTTPYLTVYLHSILSSTLAIGSTHITSLANFFGLACLFFQELVAGQYLMLVFKLKSLE